MNALDAEHPSSTGLLLHYATGYIRGLVNAGRKFEQRFPDSFPLESSPSIREFLSAEVVCICDECREFSLIGIHDAVDRFHGSSHDGSPSVGAVSDTAKPTVGAVPDRTESPSGESGAISGGAA